jgi:hypothetical protein
MLYEEPTEGVMWPSLSVCFISETTDRISIKIILEV